MTLSSTAGKRWFLLLRVSGADQHAENQDPVLRAMVEKDGGTVARVWLVEDSASQEGRDRGKGREFEAARTQILAGLRRGEADGLAFWALDRLTRLGALDLLHYLQLLTDTGADVRSYQEPWLDTVDPFARAILIPLLATIAEFESKRRSERVTAGMARVKREIEAEVAAGKVPAKRIGGRKPGSKDRKRRRTEGYEAAWKPGGAHRPVVVEPETYICQLAECGIEFQSAAPGVVKFCSPAHQKRQHRRDREPARHAEDVAAAAEALRILGENITPEQRRIAEARISHPDAPWSEVAAALGLSEKQAEGRFWPLLKAAGIPPRRRRARS